MSDIDNEAEREREREREREIANEEEREREKSSERDSTFVAWFDHPSLSAEYVFERPALARLVGGASSSFESLEPAVLRLPPDPASS